MSESPTKPSLDALDAALKVTLPTARIEVTPLPGVEEISLALINADFQTGPLPQEVMQAVIANPAYWAFCWGSGLALARFILDNPHWVQGKEVVDLGSGSGVAGIAAAMAGAKAVFACDTDTDARLASEVNAELNDIDLAVTETLPTNVDLILMADVLYDKQNLPLLELVHAHAHEVLVADSRIKDVALPQYRIINRSTALTIPNLGEFDEFASSQVWYGMMA